MNKVKIEELIIGDVYWEVTYGDVNAVKIDNINNSGMMSVRYRNESNGKFSGKSCQNKYYQQHDVRLCGLFHTKPDAYNFISRQEYKNALEEYNRINYDDSDEDADYDDPDDDFV